MTTRFLMNDRKEKAMKAFGMGGYKRGGHVTEIAIVLGVPKNRGIDKKMPVRKADGGPMPTDSPEVEQRIEDANQILRSGMGLKKGGRVKKASGGPFGAYHGLFSPNASAQPEQTAQPAQPAINKNPWDVVTSDLKNKISNYKSPLQNLFGFNKGGAANKTLKKGGKVNNGRVKKNIGGEIQKASIMGLPGYFMNKATDGYKKGGRTRKADGGSVGLSQMSNRDFNAGKNALGLKRGGTANGIGSMLKSGGDVRMAAGGVGKIRHHQMSKSGKPIKPCSCKY